MVKGKRRSRLATKLKRVDKRVANQKRLLMIEKAKLQKQRANQMLKKLRK